MFKAVRFFKNINFTINYLICVPFRFFFFLPLSLLSLWLNQRLKLILSSITTITIALIPLLTRIHQSTIIHTALLPDTIIQMPLHTATFIKLLALFSSHSFPSLLE
jgi:hypothetical protein